MSYILQEPSNFINLKLTDTGRRLLSLGNLKFKKVAILDREINYKMAYYNYDICNNVILSPKDDAPNIPSTNFDGSSFADLDGQNLGSARQIVSAQTSSTGFFTGDTNYFTIDTNGELGQGKPLGIGVIDYSISIPSGGTSITLSGGSHIPEVGNLAYIPWEPPQYSGITNSTPEIFSGRPSVSLWYRVQGVSGDTVDFDRDLPNFGSSPIIGSSQQVQTYFYPYNGIESYYGSSTTINTGVWNMNIIRTTSEIGTTTTMSGFTSYGSLEYNGTKLYLGFSSETKAFGVIHYSNSFTGNTYAEQLVPGTVEIDIPNIMWHRNSLVSPVGNEMNQGLKLYDVAGDIYTDSVSKTTYKELRDSTTSGGMVVGRVYHKLKIFIITHQELLAALTYKSNRNYTLPSLNLTTQSSPPSSQPNSTGLCKSGKTYFATYVVSSNSYEEGGSYGYPQPLHCEDISVAPIVADNNAPQFLRAEFPNNQFPFLRNESNLTTLSGTGWNANKVQILIKEVATSAVTTIGEIPTYDWKLVSNGIGNGIYTGETGQNTIDPIYLQAHSFIISQEDYDSGTTYSLSGQYSAFTMNNDITASGLTFGSESFFFGNIKTGIMSTVFKTVITVYARSDEFNSSENISYASVEDLDEEYKNTFITEFGILDDNNNLVAVAKPSYPIQKNSSKFLVYQLELDF